MANSHANETEFALRCQKVVDMLTKWFEQYGDLWMPFRDISRKLRWTRRDHEDIRNASIDQERIETDSIVTGGRPKARLSPSFLQVTKCIPPVRFVPFLFQGVYHASM